MSIRFRFGLAVGFCAGYYFGARAGEDRYKQIRRTIDRFGGSELLDKARAAVDLGIQKVREARDSTEDPALGLG